MLRKRMLGCLLLAGSLAIVACGKKETPAELAAANDTSPLSFVPADTPYVLANPEPMPEATINRWREQAQQVWPLLIPMLDDAAGKLGEKEPKFKLLFKALIEEFRTRNTPEQWQEIGLGPKVRSAIYGVGVLPVLRVELTNVEGFKAAIARVEKAAGMSLGTARVGEQDVRTFEVEDGLGLIAFEGSHLVVTVVPKAADEALKRRMLGLDRPAQSIAASGAFAAFDKSQGFLPYGSGWLDSRRLVALIGTPQSGVPGEALDPICRAEYDAMAAKMPRLSFGYTKLDANAMDVRMRLELEPALAKSLVDLGSTVPGSARSDALFDFGFGVPVLKARDFLVAQADLVAKAPYQCKDLASLNAEFAKLKSGIDKTMPPPLADLIGVRMSIDELVLPADAPPIPSDFAGSLLVGSNNPMFLVGLAQMSMPPLQKLHLNPDGKPVALPAEVMGAVGAKYEAQVAMGPKVLGLAVGKTAIANLSAAVMQAPTADGTIFSFDASGRIYQLMGDLFSNPTITASMPAEQQATMEAQRKLYALYAQWFKHIHMRMAFTSAGIDFVETVEMNPATPAAQIAQ